MKYNRQGKIYKNEDDQKKTMDGENKEKRMIHHIQYTKYVIKHVLEEKLEMGEYIQDYY